MTGFQALDRLSMLTALPGAASGHYDFPISQPIELQQVNQLYLALEATAGGATASYDILGRVQINGQWLTFPSVTGMVAAGSTSLLYTSIPMPGFLLARRRVQRCIATVFDPSTGIPPTTPPTIVALLEDLQTVVTASSGGGGGGGGQTTPNVTSVTPKKYTHTSNVPALTIAGSGFTGATSVNVGALSVPINTITDSQITTNSPGSTLAAGTYDVTVTTPAGTSATSPADQIQAL